MIEIIEEVKNEINILEEKLNNSKDIKQETKEVFTNSDAELLHNLKEILRTIKAITYNNIMDKIIDNPDSFFDTYCREKENMLLKEALKHKSKYKLKAIKNELEYVKKIKRNKEVFINRLKNNNIIVDLTTVPNAFHISDKVKAILLKAFLSEEPDENYKKVVEDLLRGKTESFKTLTNIRSNINISRQLSEINSTIWPLGNIVENYKYTKKDDVFKEIEKYMFSFRKFSKLFEEYDIKVPKLEINKEEYITEIQGFLDKLKTSGTIDKICEQLKNDNNELEQTLPDYYKNIDSSAIGMIDQYDTITYFHRTQEERDTLKKSIELLSKIKKVSIKDIPKDIKKSAEDRIKIAIEDNPYSGKNL